MGLLDEAIREHLELKRRRGADPTEVERLEREALGPVRRVAQESAQAAGVEPDELADPPPPTEFDAGSEFGPDDELEAETGYDFAPEHRADYGLDESGLPEHPSPYSPEPERPLPDPAESYGTVPPPEPAHAGDDPHGSRGEEPPAHTDLGVETAEYDVEAAHAGEDEGDDVLEETPEFLQDAPDHDRLWFEQRPPKDFDFDG